MTHADRCKLATDCLPIGEYRTRLEALHAEMLAEIDAHATRGRTQGADMTDITKRLRSRLWQYQAAAQHWALRDEAADEIDRLRAALREVINVDVGSYVMGSDWHERTRAALGE